jgi:hypothetical protein
MCGFVKKREKLRFRAPQEQKAGWTFFSGYQIQGNSFPVAGLQDIQALTSGHAHARTLVSKTQQLILPGCDFDLGRIDKAGCLGFMLPH